MKQFFHVFTMIGNGKPGHSILYTFGYYFIYFSHISSILTCIIRKIRKKASKTDKKYNTIINLKEIYIKLKDFVSNFSF